jgi:hypothetical protein
MKPDEASLIKISLDLSKEEKCHLVQFEALLKMGIRGCEGLCIQLSLSGFSYIRLVASRLGVVRRTMMLQRLTLSHWIINDNF